MSEQKWAIALHGGAGQISRDRITPEKETLFRAALARVLEIGTTLLDQGCVAPFRQDPIS